MIEDNARYQFAWPCGEFISAGGKTEEEDSRARGLLYDEVHHPPPTRALPPLCFDVVSHARADARRSGAFARLNSRRSRGKLRNRG